jgi:ribosome maturation factor RimP
MILEEKIHELISPLLKQNQVEIVRVKYASDILQFLLEKTDGSNVSISECEESSRLISRVLDVEELIDKKYTLEVGSPGLDRPLVKIEDYARFVNNLIRIAVIEAVAESKKFKARIISVNGNTITIEKQDAIKYDVNFDNIISANLVIEI